MAVTRVRRERFLFGEYTVPNTRFELPAAHVPISEVHATLKGVKVEDIVGEMTPKHHRETLTTIVSKYELREGTTGLTPAQKETKARLQSAATEATRNHQKFTLSSLDQDIAFVTVMLSTWTRGSKWAKIENVVPEIVEKAQEGLPISFYNAMSKVGPYESTVNRPDLGHVIHFGRLGKLLQFPGGPKEIHVLDELAVLGNRPDMFNGLSFDNSRYREEVTTLVDGVAPVHFAPHPAIKYDVFEQNVARFKADPNSPELVKKRMMFARGMPVPHDDYLIPVTAYLEGARTHPEGTLHTTMIERKDVLFLGLINGYAPIHGVPLIYPEVVGVVDHGVQQRKQIWRTEIVREVDVFDLQRAVDGTGASVSAIWTDINTKQGRDTVFLAYMLHNSSEAPTVSTVRDALKDALREKSVTASSGVHDNRYIVGKVPVLSESEKEKVIARLPAARD